MPLHSPLYRLAPQRCNMIRRLHLRSTAFAANSTAGGAISHERRGIDRTEETWDGGCIVLPWDAITDGNISGVRPTPPTDPLLVLLAHRDVAGEITPAGRTGSVGRLTIECPSPSIALSGGV